MNFEQFWLFYSKLLFYAEAQKHQNTNYSLKECVIVV